MAHNLIPKEKIDNKIYLIRNTKVMLDADLASLYQVPTWRLNEQVKRNPKRFPKDFMFKLAHTEVKNLRSQFAISSHGGRRYLPYAFTEQGVAMLSSVLNSERAIQVNIQIMRAFIKLKKSAINHKQLSRKLKQLENRVSNHDKDIQGIFEAIHKLIALPEKPKRKIGFHIE